MKYLVIVSLLISSLALAQFEPSDARDFSLAPQAELGTLPEGIGLAAGTAAPDAQLANIEGDAVALAELWAQQPIMLVFYRGGWCPYCNGQIRELTTRYEDFSALGVQPVLVSVDQPDASLALSANYEIPFPVLSDSDMAALEAYRVALQLDDETVEIYRGYGIDLAEWAGKDHHAIAVASAFVIDQQGVIRWSHADMDFTRRPSASQLLEIVEQLGL